MKSEIMLAALALINSLKPQAVSIPSHMVPGPNRSGRQWSKRTMQRMKGKAARLNRGRNRARYSAKGIIKRGEEKNALRASVSAEPDMTRGRGIRALSGAGGMR